MFTCVSCPRFNPAAIKPFSKSSLPPVIVKSKAHSPFFVLANTLQPPFINTSVTLSCPNSTAVRKGVQPH